MRTRLFPTAFAAILITVLGTAAPAPGSSYLGPDGKALPFTTEEEVLDFLSTAEVVDRKEIPQGVNKPLKLKLVKDGVEANAVFRTVEIRKMRQNTAAGMIVDFHDSHTYECAAYRLSRLLGLDQIPPCVERRLGRQRGTVQLWVEGAMTEEMRRKTGRKAPSSVDWVRQQQTMRLFDGLIYNFDRNQGNMLIDADWKLWFIDHTRSFHISDEVPKLERLIWCERGLLEKLKALDMAQLKGAVGDLVEKARLEAVLERRDALVEHLEKRIEQFGADIVLFDGSDPPPEGTEERSDYAVASSSEDIPEESVLVEPDG